MQKYTDADHEPKVCYAAWRNNHVIHEQTVSGPQGWTFAGQTRPKF